MSTVLLILLIAIGLALLSLLVPVAVRFSLRLDHRLSGEFRIAGVIPVHLGSGSGKDRGKEATGFPGLLELLLSPGELTGMISACIRLIRRLSGAVKISVRSLNAVYGAGDAYKTAMVLGRFYTLMYAVRFLEWDTYPLLTPDFTRKRLEGEVAGKIKIYAGRAIVPVMLFLMEKPVFTLVKTLRRKNRVTG